MNSRITPRLKLLKFFDGVRIEQRLEDVVTGLRPGEKFYEELILGDDLQPTLHPKIQWAQDPFISWHGLENDLSTLKILLSHNSVEVIVVLLQKLVVGYQPSSDVVDWGFAERMQLGNGGDI